MADFERITLNPAVMGGRPCIRGMRVTVGMVVGMVAAERSTEEVLELYPYLTREDVPPPYASQLGAPRKEKLPCQALEACHRHELVPARDDVPSRSRHRSGALEPNWLLFSARRTECFRTAVR